MAPGRAPTTPKNTDPLDQHPEENTDPLDQHPEEIKEAMNRQAATPKGFERRVQDLELSRVAEPRQRAKVKVPLPTVLVALVASMVTRARSLRMAEQRTAAIAQTRP